MTRFRDAQNKRGKKHRLEFYWREGDPFTALSEELRQSPAYKALDPHEICVLMVAMAAYNRAYRNGYEPVEDGFALTWKMCSFKISERKFQYARERLVQVGFLSLPPEKQSLSSVATNRYFPSAEWRKWEDASEFEQHLAKKEARRTKKRQSLQKRGARNAAPACTKGAYMTPDEATPLAPRVPLLRVLAG